MDDDRVERLVDDLSLLVGRHAAHLDGPTFQKACQRVAEAYWPASELARGSRSDQVDDLAAAIRAGLAR